MFGYIARHWRGEFSLPQSYWVNGALVLLPFNLYLRFVGDAFEAQPPQSPAIYIFSYLLPYLAFLPVVTWSGVGIWRSAGHRIEEGRPGWAWVARGIVILNVLTVGGSILVTARDDYAILTAFFDERAAKFSVADKGAYVMFHGEITDASANQLAPLLTNPRIKRLVINGSNGGFVMPTLRLAKAIHDHDLFVVAIAECVSSCTVLLAAGATRAVDPRTELGFHLGTIAGLDDPAQGWDEADRYYAAAGMSAELIAKIHTHRGPHDVYRPPLRELIDDGFITHVYVDKDTGYEPARTWCAETPACGGSNVRSEGTSRTEGKRHGP
jgi:hypothetical protein